MPELEIDQSSTGPRVRRKRRKRRNPQPSLLQGYPGDFRAFVEGHGDFGLDRAVLFRVWACIREAVLAGEGKQDWSGYLRAVDETLQQMIHALMEQQRLLVALAAHPPVAPTSPVAPAGPVKPVPPRPLVPVAQWPAAPAPSLALEDFIVPPVEPGIITVEDRDRYFRDASGPAVAAGVPREVLSMAVDQYIQYCFGKADHPGEATSRPTAWIIAQAEKILECGTSRPQLRVPVGGDETWANPEDVEGKSKDRKEEA